jgi:sialidase-1
MATHVSSDRNGRASIWLALFAVLVIDLSVSLLFVFAVNTLWRDVNSFVSDVLGLAANWVWIVNGATAAALVNAVLQVIRILHRRSLPLDASPRAAQKILLFPALILWSALNALLLVEAGDGVLVAQLVYHAGLVAPWICLALSLAFGALFAGSLARRAEGRASPFRLVALGSLAVLFLAASVPAFGLRGEGGGSTSRSVEAGQFFHEQILFDANADPHYATFRIPGLVITGGGVLVAYCEAREGYSDWAEIDVVMRRSLDGGETWQDRTLLVDTDEGTVNNPVMIAERDSETIHFLYNVDYERAFYLRSDDAGESWSRAVDITATFDEYRRDYDWRVIAIGPGHGIQLRSGRLLAPVWISPGHGGDGHHPQVVSTIYSDDGGRTWERGEIVGDPHGPSAGEPVAVERSDGSVLLNARSEDLRLDRVYRVVSVSPDGATGWSTPRLDRELPDPICFGSLHRYDAETLLFSNVHLGVKTDFVLRRLKLRGAREPLGIRVSFDDGASWPVAKIYQRDEAGYSDINVRNGTIYSLYEQGWEKENKYRTRYLKLVRFDLNWVTAP